MVSARRLVDIGELRTFTAVELLKDPGHDPNKSPIPACMEVRIDYSLPDAKTGHNVLHARFPGAYPGTTTLANALKAGFASLFSSSGMSPVLSTNLFIVAVALRDLSVLNQLYILSNTASSAIGTDAGQPLPVEVAAVLTERTAISGPGGRGRIYIPGFTAGSLGTGNVIGATAVTALGQLAAGLPGVFSAQSLTMCLALPSRIGYTGSTGRVHPPRTAQTADIVRVELRDNHWDSQRRRGLK